MDPVPLHCSKQFYHVRVILIGKAGKTLARDYQLTIYFTITHYIRTVTSQTNAPASTTQPALRRTKFNLGLDSLVYITHL